MSVVLFVLFIPYVMGATIYKVRDQGTCLTHISEQSVCEEQATAIHWPDTSASAVSFSSYLPSGCILQDDSTLKIYTKTSTAQCSSKYKCLCEINADLCLDTASSACICGSNYCTPETGLVCSEGICEHAPTCSPGPNNEVCNCNGVDCTFESGLVCSTGGCEHAAVCSDQQGLVSNTLPCQCGAKDCILPYCYGSESRCMFSCPAGKYVSDFTCKSCTVPGYFCPAGASKSPTEYACPAGKYGATTPIGTVDECQPCLPGRYSSASGLTSACSGQCSPGKYSTESGRRTDTECLGRCSPGKYSTIPGLTSDNECLGRCSAGKYSSKTGLTEDNQCEECSKGKYSSEIGLTTDQACLGKCAAGKYSDITGLTNQMECKVCSVNKYQNELGQRQCKGCPDDKIIQDTATASKHDNVNDCQEQIPVCMSFEYLENNSCFACPQKHFCDGTSYQLCSPGFFCPGLGEKTPCPAGKYGEANGQTSADKACIPCIEGTFQNVEGQTYCSRGCPRGTFGQVKGAKSETEACIDCPIGHKCDSVAMNRPTVCQKGSYQSKIAQEICILCEKNTYTDIFGAIICKDCPNNTSTKAEGSNSVGQCQVNKLADCPLGSRGSPCSLCKPGSYGLLNACALCPKGKYQPNKGQTKCLDTQDAGCSKILGCVSESYPLQTFAANRHQKNHLQTSESTLSLTNIIVYFSLLLTMIIILCSHRMCPECFKELDLAFSSEHVVSNTHAKRVLMTRLGASMTLSMPLIIAGLSVFVFTSPNILIQHGLVPISLMEMESDFKEINIQYVTQSPRVADCHNIQLNSKLNCSLILNKQLSGCKININCKCPGHFGGSHYIHLDLPEYLQYGVISISPTAWNDTTINITQQIEPNLQMVGTENNPSIVGYDVIRSLKQDAGQQEYGLLIQLQNVVLKESDQGSSSSHHRVSILLETSDNLFVLKQSQLASLGTQIGIILTYTISALSALKVAKLTLEKCIDNFYLKCRKNIPRDIEMRIQVLDERQPAASIKDDQPL